MTVREIIHQCILNEGVDRNRAHQLQMLDMLRKLPCIDPTNSEILGKRGKADFFSKICYRSERGKQLV